MNPYTANLYADNRDVAVVLLLSCGTIICGAYIAKYFSAVKPSESYLRGATLGLLSLNIAALVVEVVGLLGFALRVKSGLWFFWSLFFLMGVIGEFKVFPLIGIGLFAWWEVGRRRCSYSTQIASIIVKYLALNVVCVGMYFLDEWMAMAR
ncbi:MAG TPA: hypothetical protein VFC44_11640 [Candidatus Saccharimonadales bacterium]|nr:hypothetical protein [Candidatus Saccharimonadales bacterium]